MTDNPAVIMFTGDLHAHNHAEFAKTLVVDNKPINSRLYDLLETMRRNIRIAKKQGATHIVILGDIFHLRGQIPTDVMQYVYSLFDWAHNFLGLEVIILTGNHDQADKAGQIHSVYALQGVATIVDEPLMLELPGVDLWMIPFTNSHADLMHCLDALDPDPQSPNTQILCMHAGIDGSLVGPIEYRIKDPITVDDLPTDTFDEILLGHYHKPQTLAPNVRYVGSPVQHTRGEIGDTKRWLLWGSGYLRSIKSKAKEFYHLTSSELESMNALDPGYYDITIDDEQSVESVMRQTTCLDGVDQCSFKVARASQKGKGKKARIKVDGTTTDAMLLKRYLKHVAVQPADALLELGLTYLGKATGGQTAKTRIQFQTLQVENFLSIHQANLDLERPGDVIAVLGDNEDADGFDSNGAGKSSLLPESIYWCLFGQTARDIPADAVVNNVKKRDCCVSLTLLCDETVVTVKRYRKHKELGTGLSVFVDGADISQGKVADTEKLLSHMLGLDYTTFSSVVAFSPANLQFVGSADSDQKRVLDSILQTSRFSSALDLVKGDVKTLKSSMQELLEDQQVTSGRAETLLTTLDEHKASSEEFIEEEQGRVDRVKAVLADEMQALVTLKDDLEEAHCEVNEARQKLDSIVIPDVTAITEERQMLATELGTIHSELKQAINGLNATTDELAKVAKQAGQPCPTCGQPVLNTTKLMSKLSTDRSTYTTNRDRTTKRMVQVEEQLSRLAISMQDYNQAMSQQESCHKALRSAESNRNSVQASVTRQEREIEKLQSSLSIVPENVYLAKLIPETIAKLKAVRTQLKDLNQAVDKAEVDLNLLTFWVNGFGNSGVKSFLFDQIVPELTDFANHYVEQLAGDSLRVEFSTHAEGAAKDKFSIHAWNESGSDIYAGNSSGERRRIDFCVMLALFRVANNRVKMSLLLMDEVFDTLDATGIEGAVTVMEDMAKELDLTIFVTSHSNLSNMLHEQITIKKTNGLSTLV